MKTISKYCFIVLAIACTLSSCAGTYYVNVRPQEPYYVRPVSPYYGAVWIPGEWVWNGNRYAYINGHWEKPRERQVYVAGHWQESPRGYVWIKGYWK